MPNPETVKTSQTFQLDKVIYNHNGFSIGIGTYMASNTWALAMRWNGTNEKAGFPYAGKNPLWMTLPPELTFSILIGLLNEKSLSSEDYIQILEYLKDFKTHKLTKQQIAKNDELFDELFS
jgi:hypothetical protein